MNVTSDQVLAVLSRHVGRANGVTMHNLALYVTREHLDEGEREITERNVRKVISRLREDGHAICAHPRTGYFIAETAEELDECCAFLRSRAMTSLTLESKLRKIALPELLGQLRVPT